MFWVNVKGVSQWYEIGSERIKSMGGPHECPYETNCADAVRRVGICHRHFQQRGHFPVITASAGSQWEMATPGENLRGVKCDSPVLDVRAFLGKCQAAGVTGKSRRSPSDWS